MKNETPKQYESRVGTSVTQEAIARESAANVAWIDRLRNSPINRDVEGPRDRAERLAHVLTHVRLWRKKVTGWGFMA